MPKHLLPLVLCLFWLIACTPADSSKSPASHPITETDEASSGSTSSTDVSTQVYKDVPFRNFDQLLQKANPDGKPEGLLLGFQQYENKYASYYIFIEEGKIKEILELPYLATPQPDGFHFIQTFYTYSSDLGAPEDYGQSPEEFPDGMEYQYAAWKPRDFTSANALTQALAKHKKENTETLDEEETWLYENSWETILFIMPGLVTVEQSMEGYGGGVHGYYVYNTYTMPYAPGTPTPKSDRKVIDTLFQEQFSAQEWAEIKRQLYIQGPRNEDEYGGQYNGDLSEPAEEEDRTNDQIGDYDSGFAVDTEELDFILEHKRGAVQLKALAYAPAPYVLEHTYRVTYEQEAGTLGAPWVHMNPPPVPFDSLAEHESDQFFLSPGQNVIFSLHGQSLKGWDLNQGSTLSADLENLTDPQLIMVEWATGKHAQHWYEELKP